MTACILTCIGDTSETLPDMFLIIGIVVIVTSSIVFFTVGLICGGALCTRLVASAKKKTEHIAPERGLSRNGILPDNHSSTVNILAARQSENENERSDQDSNYNHPYDHLKHPNDLSMKLMKRNESYGIPRGPVVDLQSNMSYATFSGTDDELDSGSIHISSH